MSNPFVGSKPADIFSFVMLAAEVFTGKVSFEGQGDPRAAIQIS
jgi:hypothetical protein